MPLRVYATPSDYTKFAEDDWDGDPEKLEKRLRSASIEVEKLTRLSVFDTDDDGYPTDADDTEAFAEATCAIVEHWGITDDPTGAEATAGAVKIGSVSLGTTSANQDNATARDRLTRRIGERAIDVLTNAGLIGSAVAH